MLLVTPTLHFQGQCVEALALYRQAFNLRIDFVLHYADADSRDWPEEMTEHERGYVYHAEAYIGEQRLMLADETRRAHCASEALFLTITFEQPEQVVRAFEALSSGGTVIYPPRRTTYSSCMASIVDRFGFRWGLMTESL
ncbi:VOC family protein [Paenibacillus sp. NFR01]|uniref:VOC family protein n=1 Tax=Paenibacillus sp. NFR01 TaxID=1566279 RepID=UPI0008BEE46D|nr:VOC family protein [Paenibacillus sp. NFR01]SEU28148.1 PhnB protein [Paenibacillus sp. NFR01]